MKKTQYKNIGTKTLKSIKEYDTFVIPTDSIEYFDISQYSDQQRFDISEIFSEGVIKVPSPIAEFRDIISTFYIYLNIEKSIFEVYYYSNQTYDFAFMFAVKFNNIIKNEKDLKIIKISNGFDIMSAKYVMFNIIFKSLQYIIYYVGNRETTIKTETIKKKTSSANKTNNNTSNNKKRVLVINRNKIVYEVTGSNNGAIETIKKHYNRYAKSWNVVGHKRVYKSGKVVWIKPYTKGNKNEKIKSKTYIIK